MSSEHPPERGIQSHDGLHSHVVNRAEQYLLQDARSGYPSRLDILYNSGHHPVLRPISFTQRRTVKSRQPQDEVLSQSTGEYHRNSWKIFSQRTSNSGDQLYPIYSPRTHTQQLSPQIRIHPHTTSASAGLRAHSSTNSPMLDMASDSEGLQGLHMGFFTGVSHTEEDLTKPSVIARQASQIPSSPTNSNTSIKNTSRSSNTPLSRPSTPAQRQQIQFARIERLCIEALRWAWQREIEFRVQREVNVEKSWVKFCCSETAIPIPRTLPVPSRGRASSRWEPYSSATWSGGQDDGHDSRTRTRGIDRGRGRGAGTRATTAKTGISSNAMMTERHIFISPDLTEELGIRGYVRLIADLIAAKHQASQSAFTPITFRPPPRLSRLSLIFPPPNKHRLPAPSAAGLNLLDMPQLDYIGARLSNAVDAIRNARIFLTREEVRRVEGLVRELCTLVGFQKGVEWDDDGD